MATPEDQITDAADATATATATETQPETEAPAALAEVIGPSRDPLPPAEVATKHYEARSGKAALAAGIPLRDASDAWWLAEQMAGSDFVPDAYKRKPGNCLVAMQFGAEVGLSPMAALQNIAVVNGNPRIWGDGLMALCMAHPLWDDSAYRVWWDADTETGYCTMARRGGEPITRSFSMAQARSIKQKTKNGTTTLAEKDTYQNYPDQMCMRRAKALVASDVFPDALKGLMPIDIDDRVVDSTAERVPASAALASRLGAKTAARAQGVKKDAPAPRERTGPTTIDGEVEPAGDPTPCTAADIRTGIEQAKTIDDVNAWLAHVPEVPEGERVALRKLAGKRVADLRPAS